MSFNVDPWEAARLHYEREMHRFMARLMRHFNVTQIELPMYELPADAVIERTDLIDKGAVFYRIKGHLDLRGSKDVTE